MKSKNLLLLLILCCATFASRAQINPGKIMLGGSANYNSADDDRHSFYTNLQAGKVLTGNSVLGIMVSYSSNNYIYTPSFKNKTRSIGGGVFYRKYKPLGRNFYAFGEINAGYSQTNNEMEYFNNSSQYLVGKTDLVSMYFIPGISYAVCKKMQIELTMPNIAYISYQHISTIDKYLPPSTSPQKRNAFSANVNLNSNLLNNFGIGFKFFLGK